MFLAAVSDRFKHRFAFIIVSCLASISGFAVLLTAAPSYIKYGSLFLVTCGTYGAMPIIVCWFNMNLGGHHRRSVGSGMSSRDPLLVLKMLISPYSIPGGIR